MKLVLVVEDDSRIASALSIRLKSEGYETVLAPDAYAGMQRAALHPPDLLLMDISLPGGDGFTVAERIRHGQTKPTPVIFITASKRPGLVDRAVELGAEGFFEKPFLTDQLMTAVKRSLGDL
jgi:two-component system KDP operon response regulator KdpE